MLRKIGAGLILAALAFACVLSSAAQAARLREAPPIFVGGRAVHEPALLEHGHVLVPVRGVFETLHASVVYTAPHIVVVRKGESVLAGLVIGSQHAVVNNRPFYLAVAPIRRGRRVYVPLRVIAEIAGATVDYERNPRLIAIHVPAQELADELPAPLVPPAPLDAGPPLWAVGVVGVFVVAFLAEGLRQLIPVMSARRKRASR